MMKTSRLLVMRDPGPYPALKPPDDRSAGSPQGVGLDVVGRSTAFRMTGGVAVLGMTLVVGVVAALAQYGMARRWSARMPDRMITHIGFSGPDGWMPRQSGLRIGWMVAAGVTIIFVLLSLRPRHARLSLFVIEAAVQLLLLALMWYLYRLNETSSSGPSGPRAS
jgi:hypothetical protein